MLRSNMCAVFVTCTRGNSVRGEGPTCTGVRFLQVHSTGSRVQATRDRCTVFLTYDRYLYVRSVWLVLSIGGIFSQ